MSTQGFIEFFSGCVPCYCQVWVADEWEAMIRLDEGTGAAAEVSLQREYPARRSGMEKRAGMEEAFTPEELDWLAVSIDEAVVGIVPEAPSV